MSPARFPDRPPDRVLVIQLRRIGDVVLATPLLDAVRAAWPGARVALLTSPPACDLFAGDDRLDALWVLRERGQALRLARRLRAERYDLVLDPQSLPLTAFLGLAAGGYRVGFRRRARRFAYHRAVDHDAHRGTDYAADHKLDLLRAVGVAPRLGPPRLPVPPAGHAVWDEGGRRPRVAVLPVSPRAYKRWGPERFGAAARALAERGARVVLVGGPGEGAQLADTARAAGGDLPTHVAASLAEFAAVLAGADALLGNDNGPRHVAMALGVPTVAWFGPQNPSHWTPPGDPLHAVILDPAAPRGTLRDDLRRVPDDPGAAAEAVLSLIAPGREARQARVSSAAANSPAR